MTIQASLHRPVPLSEIRPAGWLREQLQIQLDGLSGNLDKFWPDIANSAWIGGDAEGWERFPYWLDGVIPLAWLLDHTEMKQRITGYMDYILSHQHEDGWLGPKPEQDALANDVWSQFLALKMLMVYEDASGDPRIEAVIEKGLRKIDQHINFTPIAHWAHSRWYECLLPICWLYERSSQQWLIELACKLKAQGFDWVGFFGENWPYKRGTRQGEWNYMSHIVNNTMALKSGALWWRFSDEEKDLNHWHSMQQTLDKYHGMPHGSVTGDECLAGKSPVQGTELCAVVEQMYSMEVLAGFHKDSRIGDRLEQLAFNALPAAISADMWTHQYDQQINQVECSVRENVHWTTNHGDANIYGLEPHFGCCTANFNQGYPKFAASLWQRADEHRFVALSYAPNTLTTSVDSIPVSIELDTAYPFRETLTFKVSAETPVTFALELRIPGWCQNASLKMGSRTLKAKAGEYLVLEQEWSGKTEFELILPMTVQVGYTSQYSAHITRGPLLFGYKIPSQWQQINLDVPGREAPHCDWEVKPVGDWNYALVDRRTPKAEEGELNITQVFHPDHSAIRLTMDAVQANNWQYDNGNAAPIPSNILAKPEVHTIELIPYGATDIRIAEFPVFKLDKEHHE